MSDRNDERVPALEDLYADRGPPRRLEERVAAVYERANPRGGGTGSRIRSGGVAVPSYRFTSWPYRVAAGVVLFLAGFGSAWMLAEATRDALRDGPAAVAVSPAESATESRRFMLLLWERPNFAPGVAPARLATEYAEWARGVAGEGLSISGNELGTERVIAAHGAAAQPDGSASQAHVLPAPTGVPARLGGFFIVEVPDLAAARRLAEGHPHLAYGGWIEIAEVL